VLVVVIATVGQETVGLLARTSELSGDWPAVQILEQRYELCDVVAVPTSQRNREWDAARVDEEVVL
jgi:hypothetical protein